MFVKLQEKKTLIQATVTLAGLGLTLFSAPVHADTWSLWAALVDIVRGGSGN